MRPHPTQNDENAGWMRGRKVLILIDSGASHNFIARELVKEFGIPVEDAGPYQVCLCDGQMKGTQGCCREVSVTIGEAELEEQLYLFELGGVNLILGLTGWKNWGR